MRNPLVLRAADLVAERPDGSADDIHFTEALAASIIGYASRPGELVLDPFAGYGTTMVVAERLGRRGIGSSSCRIISRSREAESASERG